jgi:hypothetical protein
MVLTVAQIRELAAQTRDEKPASNVSLGTGRRGNPGNRPQPLEVIVSRTAPSPGTAPKRRFSLPHGA